MVKILGVEPSEIDTATGAAAAHPVIFCLAVPAKHQGDIAEGTLDSWLSYALVPPNSPDRLAATDFETFNLEVPKHVKSS